LADGAAKPGWERSTVLFAFRVVRGGAGSGDARVPRSRPQWRIAVHGTEGPQIEIMAFGSVLRGLADERERNQYHWLMSLRWLASERSAELVKTSGD
jgi:hypothetical protein